MFKKKRKEPVRPKRASQPVQVNEHPIYFGQPVPEYIQVSFVIPCADWTYLKNSALWGFLKDYFEGPLQD